MSKVKKLSIKHTEDLLRDMKLPSASTKLEFECKNNISAKKILTSIYASRILIAANATKLVITQFVKKKIYT